MKKTLTVASLIAAAVIFGFFSVSWAVERPNTPECAEVNGSSDPDACLTQYIEPLQKELEALWFQLVKLQGKKSEDNPWIFKTDNSACDENKPEYYDEKTCKMHTPGKLAQEKYLIRGKIQELVYRAKVRQQKAQFEEIKKRLAAAEEKLAEKDKELAGREREIKELKADKDSFTKKLVESNKAVEDQRQRGDNFKILFIAFLVVTVASAIYILVNKID